MHVQKRNGKSKLLNGLKASGTALNNYRLDFQLASIGVTQFKSMSYADLHLLRIWPYNYV